MSQNRNQDGANPFVPIHLRLKRGQFRQALADLLDEEGRLRSIFKSDVNHGWYCVGDAYYRSQDFISARTAFVRSLRSRPDDVAALVAVGNSYDAMKRPHFAGRYFERALRAANEQVLDKEEIDAIVFNLGNALFDLGRFKDAVALYQKVSGNSLISKRAQKNAKIALKQI